MKNLKKVLSLALVFAMVLGLCIGASAAQDVTTLSDWGTVGHQSAAQLLNSFNIMQGYTDGTFRPTRLVTRAEAVKMIDVGLWGGVDQPELFASNEIAFTDVKPTDWYAGHVVYAQALGILDGYPDGSFRPNENVTGYQLLKMALIALNYNSEVEGLTGTGWDIRTMRLATDPTVKNLTANLSEIKNWNDPLTRDQAAQIIANMITHEYVTYDLNQNGQVGNIKSYDKGTFGKVFLGLTEGHGTLVANAYANISKVDYTDEDSDVDTINPKRSSNNVLVKIPTYDKNNKVDGYTNVGATLDSTLADIGRPVTLYYKGSVLVGAALDQWIEVEAEWNAAHDKITNTEDDYATYTHGDLDEADYVVTKYYDLYGNGYIDIITNICYGEAQKVEDVTTTKNFGTVYQTNEIKWRSGFEDGSFKPENFVVEDDANFTAKKGDYISYNTLTNVFGDDATYGLVLDPVEGKVNRVVNTTTTHTVSIDGVAYPLVKSLIDSAKSAGKIAFGTEGTFYLYPNDTIGASEGKAVQTETHYGVIYDAGYAPTGAGTAIDDKQATLVQVCAILDDGTSGVFNVNGMYQTVADVKDPVLVPTSAFTYTSVANESTITVNGVKKTVKGFFASDGDLKDVDNDNGGVDKLVTYTVNDDGSLNLSIVTGGKQLTAGTVTADKPVIADPSDKATYYFNSKTLTFVQTEADGEDEAWTVAVGLPTSSYSVKTNITVYTTNPKDTTSVTALINGKDATDAKTDNKSEFLYVLGGGAQIGVKNGSPVYEVTVYNSETDKVETLEVTGDYTVGKFYNGISNGKFGTEITVTANAKGNNAGFITKFADNVIRVEYETNVPDKDTEPTFNGTTYIVTKDTRYYYIDGDSSAEVAANEIGAQSPIDSTTKDGKTTTYYQTVILTNSADEAAHVITFANPQSVTTDA